MTNYFATINVKNVLVTANGVVLKNFRPIEKSVVRQSALEKYRKIGFLLKYLFPTLNFKNTSDTILITDEWSKNYCHWLWEALTKLLILQKNHPNAKLIFPKAYLKVEYMKKALEAFEFKENDLILINKKSHLKVKNLNFIGCMGIGTPGYYDFLQFSKVRDKIIAHFKNELTLDLGERIYISRSDPAKKTARKVANEEELENLLHNFGFKTIYMENYQFLDQISIASKAKYIVSPHGAGITNAMFIPDGGTMIELVNQSWNKTCFAEMFERMNINYIRQDAKAKNDKETLHLVDIVVDIKALKEILINLNL